MPNGQSHSSFVPWKLASAASSWYLMMTTTPLLTLTTVISTTSSWYLAIVAPNVIDIVSVSVEEIRTPPGGGGIPDGWDDDYWDIERWENDGGKNQRRFFFFYNQKLWKMYISLDVSMM